MENAQLSMTLDLKPFIASLQSMQGVSKETISVIQQLFATVKPPKFTPERTEISLAEQDLQRLKQAYYMVTLGEENATVKAYEFAQSQNLSSSQIDLLINSMLKEQSLLSMTSTEYGAVQNSINSLVIAKQKLSQTTGQVSTGMSRAAQSTLSLSYIVRDAPYFFQNFNMGIMAVGNNLNPFIDQMLRAKQETGSWRGAIKNLASGLGGVGGLSFVFSLAVSAITAWSLSSAKAERETKSLKDTVKDLTKEYEDLMRVQISQKMDEWTEKYEEQTKAIKDRLSFWQKLGSIIDLDRGVFKMMGLGDLSDEEIENLKKLRQEEEALNKALNDKGRIPQLEATIKYITELKRKLPDSAPQASFDSYNNSIKTLQAELDVLNGKVKDKKKDDKIPEEIKFRREHLGLTNEMIRAEIALIDARLRDPNFKGDRVQELKNRIELQKVFAVGAREQLETFAKLKHLKLDDKFIMFPVDAVPKPEVFKETNDELQRMLDLSDMLTNSFNSAATAVSSAAAAGIYMFKQENSLLQIFVNNLIRATAEALTLKLITTGLNIVGGLFGFPFFGSAATGIAGMAGGANSSLSNSGLSNIGVSSSASLNRNVGSSVTVQQVPIVLDTRVRGRDIYLVNNHEKSWRRKYMGSSD